MKSQDEVLEEVGDRRISSSHKEYEKRRMSRIEERRAELEKLAKDKENEEKERLERIERRRQERFVSFSINHMIIEMRKTIRKTKHTNPAKHSKCQTD